MLTANNRKHYTKRKEEATALQPLMELGLLEEELRTAAVYLHLRHETEAIPANTGVGTQDNVLAYSDK
jgi:hypothetical protein